MANNKGLIAGFKTFIMRGNAIDLAVGVVIGAAFSGVVTALVEKVLNPLIGMIFGQPDFDSALSFTANGATVSIGAVITALVKFLLVALALYLFVVIPMNKLAERRGRGEEPAPEVPAEPTETELLKDIRDLLAKDARA